MNISSKHALLLAILTIGSMGTGLANDTETNKQPEQQSFVQNALATAKKHRYKIIAGMATIAAIGLGYWCRESLSFFVANFSTKHPQVFDHVIEIETISDGRVKVYKNIDEIFKQYSDLNQLEILELNHIKYHNERVLLKKEIQSLEECRDYEARQRLIQQDKQKMAELYNLLQQRSDLKSQMDNRFVRAYVDKKTNLLYAPAKAQRIS